MEDYFTHRNSSARFEFGDVDDSGPESYAGVKGLIGEEFEKVLRIQPHGFSSVPIKGAHGLGIGLGGKRDVLALLGGEHVDKRPKNLGVGNTAIYNADGTIMKIVGKDVSMDAAGNVTYTVKSVTFKCGGETLTFDASGLKHNGHDIGRTHLHKNAGGAGLSGEPQ